MSRAPGGEGADSNASQWQGGVITPPTAPSLRAQGAVPQTRFSSVGAWAVPLPSNAPPRPPLAAASAFPQHGLAKLAGRVPVGRQLRAAAPCARLAPEPPQLPSAADPPRPIHGAQQAAAVPNRVSAGLRRDAGLGRRARWERGLRGGGGGGLGVSTG